VHDTPGDKHLRKISRRCESAGVVFAEWPVISESVEKSRRPMLQQVREDLSLSLSKSKYHHHHILFSSTT